MPREACSGLQPEWPVHESTPAAAAGAAHGPDRSLSRTARKTTTDRTIMTTANAAPLPTPSLSLVAVMGHLSVRPPCTYQFARRPDARLRVVRRSRRRAGAVTAVSRDGKLFHPCDTPCGRGRYRPGYRDDRRWRRDQSGRRTGVLSGLEDRARARVTTRHGAVNARQVGLAGRIAALHDTPTLPETGAFGRTVHSDGRDACSTRRRREPGTPRRS